MKPQESTYCLEDLEFEKDERKLKQESLEEEIRKHNDSLIDLNERIYHLHESLTSEIHKNIRLKNETGSTINVPHVIRELAKGEKLNIEHKSILKTKYDSIQPVIDEIFNMESQRTVLQNELDTIRNDCHNNYCSIVSLKEEQRILNMEYIELTERSISLQNFIQDKNTECKMLSQIRSEALIALGKLEARETEFESSQGGLFDCNKEVGSLQKRLNNVNEQIETLQSSIQQINNENDTVIAKFQMDNQNHNSSVNWIVEKKELTKELSSIKEELRKRSNVVSSKEKVVSKESNDYQKYYKIYKKWSNNLENVEIPNESLECLWDKYETLSKHNTHITDQYKDDLDLLTDLNIKLQDDLEKKKAQLDRIISSFDLQGNNERLKIEKDMKEADEMESSLLSQIQELRMKEAEKLMSVLC